MISIFGQTQLSSIMYLSSFAIYEIHLQLFQIRVSVDPDAAAGSLDEVGPGRADMSPRKPGGKRRSQQKPQFFHGMLMWKWIFHDISSSVQKVRLDSCHVFQVNFHCCKVNLSFPSQMSVFSTRSIAEFLGKFLVFRVCSLGLNSSCRAAKSYLRLQLLMAEYLHIRSISKFVYRG